MFVINHNDCCIQGRGQISGLMNFGNTCFLNTLLQSLAACPQFIVWLQLQDSSDKKSLISSIQTILDCVNGKKLKM